MIDETEDASEQYEDWLEKKLNALDVDEDDNMRKGRKISNHSMDEWVDG